ncbi:MAG TPA: hypothetical protein VM120_21005 [Bryobacteraceae bacterium]|nr:hypothetical protein [Bryobacteraceae bacterium]
MPNTIDCIERLQAVVDKLHAEGVQPVYIVTALVEVTIKAAKLDRALDVITNDIRQPE